MSKITIRDLVALSLIADVAQRSCKVRWLMDNDEIGEGTARSIGDERGNFLRSDQDVREGFLRITSVTGLEHFIPVTKLMIMINDGEFATY